MCTWTCTVNICICVVCTGRKMFIFLCLCHRDLSELSVRQFAPILVINKVHKHQKCRPPEAGSCKRQNHRRPDHQNEQLRAVQPLLERQNQQHHSSQWRQDRDGGSYADGFRQGPSPHLRRSEKPWTHHVNPWLYGRSGNRPHLAGEIQWPSQAYHR